MNYRERHIEGRVTRIAGRLPVVLVGGARQSGKSTLLAWLFGGRCRTFVFDSVTDAGGAKADPELFLRLNPPPLILDEVQHVPRLLDILKREVDARPGEAGLYFLSGSQQLQVLKNVSESLAGRVAVIDLWPLSRAEIDGGARGGLVESLFRSEEPALASTIVAELSAAPRSLASSGRLLEGIFRGGYPRLLEFETAEIDEWFASYLRTYVERDVRLLRDLSDPHDFSRFVRLLAALTAQELNLSQLGREIGITPRTARGWLGVLASSYQAELLDAYSGNAVKRVSGRPKCHLADTGFACHLAAISSPTALGSHPLLGSLFETYAVGEVLKHVAGLSARPRPWHWRTRGGAEVDLVLERDGTLFPFECRLKARPTRRDLSGMRALVETYPRQRFGPLVVIHGGTELYLLDEDAAAVPVSMI
jgi:hypothetical protein